MKIYWNAGPTGEYELLDVQGVKDLIEVRIELCLKVETLHGKPILVLSPKQS